MSTFEEIRTVVLSLSPSTILYSVVALVLAVAYIVFFASSVAKRRKSVQVAAPPPPPFTLGDVTPDVLAQYDGSDESRPLLMAIKGVIFDVSRGWDFYGPGGPYELFAGKDASRALAKMSFEDDDINNPCISDLTFSEMETLNDWEMRFDMKYKRVGRLIEATDKATDKATSEEKPKDNTAKED